MSIAPGQGRANPGIIVFLLFFLNLYFLLIWSFAASFTLEMTNSLEHLNAWAAKLDLAVK